MKIGDEVIMIRDFTYFDSKGEKQFISKGAILKIDKFSKEDFKFERRKREGKYDWYVSLYEIPNECFIFPNFYMKLNKREQNLKILLDEDRRPK